MCVPTTGLLAQLPVPASGRFVASGAATALAPWSCHRCRCSRSFRLRLRTRTAASAPVAVSRSRNQRRAQLDDETAAPRAARPQNGSGVTAENEIQASIQRHKRRAVAGAGEVEFIEQEGGCTVRSVRGFRRGNNANNSNLSPLTMNANNSPANTNSNIGFGNYLAKKKKSSPFRS